MYVKLCYNINWKRWDYKRNMPVYNVTRHAISFYFGLKLYLITRQ